MLLKPFHYLQQLLCAPEGMLATQLQDLFDEILRCLMWAAPGPSGELFESLQAAIVEAIDPLVARWPAHAIAVAELRDREGTSYVIGNK